MIAYRVSVALHLLAATVWLGHMFFWSLFAGPVVKRIGSPETGQALRALSLRMGGLGWPALLVLAGSGAIMLQYRLGVDTPALDGTANVAFIVKMFLVGLMVLYQVVVGHRSAPRAIYVNMVVALLVLAASVVLART